VQSDGSSHLWLRANDERGQSACRLRATAVDVTDEQRQISVAGGAFADHFDPAVHT
jgi:hypothetical protein